MADEERQRQSRSASAGDVVYGIGLIGALVWYWQKADGIGGHFLGVLKAFVWPAYLVYEAFKVLHAIGIGTER